MHKEFYNMQIDELPILDFGTNKEYVCSGTKLCDIIRTMAKIYLIDTVTENKITDPDYELLNSRTYKVITELDEIEEKLNQFNNKIKELNGKTSLARPVKDKPARLQKYNTLSSVKRGNFKNNGKLELTSSKNKKSKKEISEQLVKLFVQEEREYCNNLKKIKFLKDKLLERKIIEQNEINIIFSFIESIGKASSILIQCIKKN